MTGTAGPRIYVERVHGIASDSRLYQAAAGLQAIDAAICVPPIPYVRQCLDDVEFPDRGRWIFPIVKAASAVGLAGASRFPGLARLTAAMLTVYFSLATGAHVRVRDFRLNFLAAISLFIFYAVVTVTGPPRPRSSPTLHA